MPVNDKQQKVLVGAAIAFVCALIYPPFHFRYPNGVVVNLGYGFIFDPPATLIGQTLREGTLTTEVLLMEWIAIAVVAGVLWLLAKNSSQEQHVVMPDIEKSKLRPSASAVTSQNTILFTDSPENQEKPIASSISTDQIYEQALSELENGTPMKAPWARALAESDGDESKAKARYINYRVEMLKAEAAAQSTAEPVAEVSAEKPAESIQQLYAAAIGSENTAYYLEKFERFDQQGLGLKASWNWPALLFSGFWALHRKMYGWFFAWLVFCSFANTSYYSKNVSYVDLILFINAGLWILFTVYANSLYHNNVKKKIAVAQLTVKDESKLREFLVHKGGVWFEISRVIWVVVAIFVVGIVAAIVLPQYQDYTVKEKLLKVAGFAAPIKTGLALYYQENSGYPSATDDWASLGLPAVPTPTAEVMAVSLTASTGAIVVTLGGIKTGTIDGTTITMIPTAFPTEIRWTYVCTSTDPILKKLYSC